ncbi:MAG: hypothetical protein PGN07_07885 [Aeromicrobium erythreum]
MRSVVNAAQQPRRQLVIPALVLGAAVLAIIVFLAVSGGDEEKPAARPTPTQAGPTPETAKVKGSGDAPEQIAIKEASVARGTAAIGIGVDLPDLDLDDLQRIAIEVQQGSTRWMLTTEKDPRDAFVTPRLEREKDGKTVEYACAKATIQAATARLSVTLPLACLDRNDEPVRVRLALRSVDGGTERTATTKELAAPKS